jgi:hypothetical protein
VSALAFRNLLEQGDVDGLCAAWGTLFPGMPQPDTREQAEIVMHRARTETQSLALAPRAWSHRWLTERDLPSGLPDALRPSAERMYPRVALAVGISVNMRSAWMRPAVAEVRGAMEHAVLEADADGWLSDSVRVKARMLEAKGRTMRALFGM